MGQSQPASATTAEETPALPKAGAPPWEPPALLWEQDLVALTQVSNPNCNPGQDPGCPY